MSHTPSTENDRKQITPIQQRPPSQRGSQFIPLTRRYDITNIQQNQSCDSKVSSLSRDSIIPSVNVVVKRALDDSTSQPTAKKQQTQSSDNKVSSFNIVEKKALHDSTSQAPTNKQTIDKIAITVCRNYFYNFPCDCDDEKKGIIHYRANTPPSKTITFIVCKSIETCENKDCTNIHLIR